MKVLSFILMMFTSMIFSQEVVENDSLLLWQANRPLKWDDFKGKQLNHHGNVLAETYGEIKTVDCIWVYGNVPFFKVAAFMNKHNSWTVTNDLESLEHEQIHFNIFELIARRIRKKFSELNQKKITDIAIYEKAFADYIEMNRKLHEEYDIDVVTDQNKQKKWQNKVSKELERLKEYEYIPKQ